MQVDDFDTREDFKKFVRELSPQEIRNWSTTDWLDLFKKIKSLNKNEWDQWKDDFVKSGFNKDIKAPRVLVTDCCEEFIKLYENYRLIPEDFEMIRYMAKIAGTNLAKQNKLDLAKILVTSNEIDTQLEPVVNEVQLLSQTPHPVELDFEHKIWETTEGHANYKKITLNKPILKDSFLLVSAHEAAHALLQREKCTYAEKDFTPKALAISESFSELMFYNHEFYLNPSYFRGSAKMTSSSERKKLHHAYKHQPIEKHAELFGCFLERHFRKLTGQLSERCFFSLMSLLEKPLNAKYENQDIVVNYPLSELEKIKSLIDILPKDTLRYTQEKDCILLKLSPSVKADIKMRKLKERKLKVGKDISFEQYFNSAFNWYINLDPKLPLPPVADFSKHTTNYLNNMDCSHCNELILPRSGRVSNTKLPAIVSFRKSHISLQECDFTDVQKFAGYEGFIKIYEGSFPDGFDFSGIKSINFKDVDFSKNRDIQWPTKISSMKGCKLPEMVDFSRVKSINLCGVDLSKTKSIILPYDMNNITISKEMLEKYPILVTALNVVKLRKKLRDKSIKKEQQDKVSSNSKIKTRTKIASLTIKGDIDSEYVL